jgi:hypothetical protein
MCARIEDIERSLYEKNDPNFSGLTQLDNVFIYPRDPGSNIGIDKKISDSVCVEFEFKFGWH